MEGGRERPDTHTDSVRALELKQNPNGTRRDGAGGRDRAGQEAPDPQVGDAQPLPPNQI